MEKRHSNKIRGSNNILGSNGAHESKVSKRGIRKRERKERKN